VLLQVIGEGIWTEYIGHFSGLEYSFAFVEL
jgi:hypothetical protein